MPSGADPQRVQSLCLAWDSNPVVRPGVASLRLTTTRLISYQVVPGALSLPHGGCGFARGPGSTYCLNQGVGIRLYGYQTTQGRVVISAIPGAYHVLSFRTLPGAYSTAEAATALPRRARVGLRQHSAESSWTSEFSGISTHHRARPLQRTYMPRAQ